MFGGNPICNLSMALTQNCKRASKLNYNALIICRNKTTVMEGATNDQRSVADFYAGKSVFITGGTGFLGKSLIEKILYSCSDMDKIFILIREKKGQSISERIRQMLNNPLFDRVKRSRPQTLKKIVPVIGDISMPNLGITPEDEQALIDTVSVVFHSAATVKFFEPLSVAMNLNFEGTRRVIDISKRMKKLDNFVYISTAYSQSMYPVLEERVYPAPADVKDIYKFIENNDLDKKKTLEFVKPHPHTYAYTKSLAENYSGTRSDIPVTIVRPSLVGATIKEPYPGWLDNWYGMTGAGIDVSRGLNKYCLGTPENRSDLIPVDYVTNLSLVAGAKHKGGQTVPVYNSVSSGTNPVKWRKVFDKFIEESRKHGVYEANPQYIYYKTKFGYELATLLFQKAPTYMSDLVLRLKGEEPRNMAFLRRVLTTRHSQETFVGNDWTFKADAARALYASLSKADQEEFPCDPADINWDSYLKDYYHGVLTHLLPKQLEREKAALTPKSVRKSVAN